MNFDDSNYLDKNNPRLKFLEEEYSKVLMCRLSMWRKWVDTIPVKQFRGDPYYLGQLQFGMKEQGYYDAYDYIKKLDYIELFDKLEEDDAFDVVKFYINNRIITRDLMDSIIEIYFLEKHLQISRKENFNILDIGAGYGRFAHRMVSAFNNVCVDLTDCVPFSTFISEYYLWYRKITDKTKVIPLHKICNLQKGQYDLVVNIHSFPECPLSSIRDWLVVIKELEIPYLFIVGHHIPLESLENDKTSINFYNEIIKNGFKEKVFQYKIGDSKQFFNKEYVGFSPFYLFERK